MKTKRFGIAAISGPLGMMSAAERSKGRYMRDGSGHPAGGETLQALLVKHSEALEKKFTEQGTSLRDVEGRLLELEQKAARPRGTGGMPETYGAQVASSPELKYFMESRQRTGGVRIELKAITSAAGSGGGMIFRDQDPDISRMAQRTTRIRDLLNVVPTSAGSVDYPQQTTRTNAAAAVAEGTTKPYSNYGWTKINLPMRTIAHLAKLTRQAVDDSAQLQSEVDSEMRYGLQLQEDTQLLLGDGTGENLTGLRTYATPYSAPSGITVPGMTVIDKIGLAMVQLAQSEFMADGVILNPVDWWQICLVKDAAGGYIGLNPTDGKMGGASTPMLFGKPVAVTTAATVGSFMVGAFKEQKLYDRMAPEVLISSENADDFEKNLLTLRCEERLALAVRKPLALIKGTFA